MEVKLGLNLKMYPQVSKLKIRSLHNATLCIPITVLCMKNTNP